MRNSKDTKFEIFKCNFDKSTLDLVRIFKLIFSLKQIFCITIEILNKKNILLSSYLTLII